MIPAMGIIRPQVTDNGDRWAIAPGHAPDELLIGTRAAVLAFSEEMDHGSLSHVIYRRPSSVSDWQLVQPKAIT